MGIKRRTLGKYQVFDTTEVGIGWKLYTYAQNGLNTTLKATYQDKNGATPHANPIIFDGRGEKDIWWNGNYDIKLTDANDNIIWTLEDVGEGEEVVNYGNYNLVPDGGFEDDSNGDSLPDQWAVTVYPTAGLGAGVAVLDTTDQIEGAKSLKFTSQGNGGGYAVSGFFEVRQGRDIFLAWMMKSSVVDVRNLVEVVWYTAAQVQISTSSIYDDSTTNPTSWTEKAGSVTPPSTARYGKVRVTGCHSSDATPGSTWFDDVVCTDAYTGPYVKKTGDTMTGSLVMNNNLVLNNNIALNGKETGGSSRNLAKMNASNIIEYGSSANNALLQMPNFLDIAGTASISRSSTSVFLCHGAYYNGSNWIATATSASLVEIQIGGIYKYHNSGLPIGNPFTPTLIYGIDTTGKVTNGIIDYSGSVVTKKPKLTLNTDGGIHATGFQVDTVIGAAWESVGPTGSGASTLMTALDDVPSGAHWISVRINLDGTSAAGSAWQIHLYARQTGSSAGIGANTRISKILSSSGADSNFCEVRIPINSSRMFDLYFTSSATISDVATIYLAGWGYN